MKLESKTKPGVTYDVALRIALEQPLRLNTLRFEYDWPAKVEDDRGRPHRTVRIRHELGYSVMITDLGQPLDADSQDKVLKILQESTIQGFQQTGIQETIVADLPSRQFAGSVGRCDLHGGDMIEALVPFSIYSVTGRVEVDAKSEALARAFGLPYLVPLTLQPGAIGGTTAHAAAAAGVPSIVAEAGSSGLLTEPETQTLVDGIENALRSLDMLAGEPQRREPVEIGRFTWLRSPAEGMWYPSVAVGAQVRQDQRIGRIGNLYGDTLADITAPHDGVVLFITSAPAMPHDGLIIAVGET